MPCFILSANWPTDVSTDDEPGPKQELKKELAGTISELLLTTVPKEAKYAELNSKLTAFMECAHEMGLINEAATKVMNHKQKRRRVSEDRCNLDYEKQGIATCNPMDITKDVSTIPPRKIVEECSVLSQSSNNPLFSPLDSLPSNLWDLESLGFLNSTSSGLVSPTAPIPVGYAFSIENIDKFFGESLSVDTESCSIS